LKEPVVPNRDVVVIGGSAGGIEALTNLVSGFPNDLAAAVFIVVHTAPESPGYLAQIISRAGPLRAQYALDGARFDVGQIYVAPADHHLLLNLGSVMNVVRGPRENRTRPAVDPLFRSAALAYGPRVIGVVLSGALDDGTAGLRAIKMCGGLTMAQDPADALVGSMPTSALRNVSIDYTRPATELAGLIAQLAQGKAPEPTRLERKMKKLLEVEVDAAKGHGAQAIIDHADPSLFTCPECHGALLKLRGEKPLRYRCHTGHAFTADSLLAELSEATEEAVWNAVRSIQESSMLMNHLADHWRESDPRAAGELSRRAKIAQARAANIRGIASELAAMSEEKAKESAE
jgi:two-component system, chemotaxis family, protein-glutamate methylesterase/glutaminase